MYSKTKYLLLCILIVVVTIPANVARGALLSVDWQVAGDDLITRDTTSGLDWLDVTETGNRSYDDVSSQLGAGAEFAGFRYATQAEVTDLFNQFGLPFGFMPMSVSLHGGAASFHNLFGTLLFDTNLQADRAEGLYEPTSPTAGSHPRIGVLLTPNEGGTSTGGHLDSTANSIFGSYLVRAVPTELSITVDPSGYLGQWGVFDTSTLSFIFTGTGAQTLMLEPGSYRIAIGETQFFIDIASNGDVTSLNQGAAVGGPSMLTFNTVNIAVDPVNYAKTWAMSRGVFSSAGGLIENIVLVATLDYALLIGEGRFTFHVDAAGLVTENSAAAVGAQNLLTFANVLLRVDPATYLGHWGFTRGLLASTGGVIETVTLVPALRYAIGVANLSRFRFDIDGAGLVSVPNGISAAGGVGALTFNTVTIFVEVGIFTGQWQIQLVPPGPVTGNGSIELVPSIDYTFQVIPGGAQTISVTDNPCAVDPTNVVLGGDTFNLSCGAPDTDGDGVSDDADNCPAVINPAQLDQDLDGLGDSCDSDLDGDGFENIDDNCPDISNPDQADLDGDGSGDACDADCDGDSVPDDVDNCLLVPNTGQGDTDMDGSGDACDTDDDNDGVVDAADNCPLTPNPTQSDFDANGQGDACDGDVDGDGIQNDLDRCPLSPVGQLGNPDGCTASQFIELQCVREDFVQLGQYVSCVAHTANDAVDQGLISPNEKSRFVKAATKSK